MFKNRSFNIIVGFVIVVLAVLNIATAIYSQQTPSVTHAVPSPDEQVTMSVVNVAPDRSVTSEDFVPSNRLPTAGYTDLKDRQLSRMDIAADIMSAQKRYDDAFKEWELLQAESKPAANGIEIPVTGSAEPTSAERYANLKDAQLDRLDSAETISAGRARYMNLKDTQLERPGLNRTVTPELSNER